MRIFVLIQALLLSTTPLFSSENRLTAYCEQHLDEVIDHYLTDTPRNELIVTPLTGGHSNTCLKVVAKSGVYVLRIKGDETSETSLKRELYAMKEGEKIGIAPPVRFVSKDLKAVLMDYIGTNTVMIDESKEPANCAKIADTIRKAHSTPKNPYVEESINDTAMSVFNDISGTPGLGAQLAEAKNLMWEYTRQLEAFESCKVNIHGELNSRNIFLTGNGAIFIDWEYAGWEDPFFDLSYLALRLAYSPQEELMLLENYLQRPPTAKDVERYTLTKKIHLAQLAIYFHYFSLKFNPDRKVLSNAPPKENWACYMKLFSDQQDDEEGLAQFYHDLARICLNMAGN